MESTTANVTACTCTACPSSLTLPRGDGGKPVTVLANGSPFIYLLDPAAGLLGVVKFVCGVQYCGSLHLNPQTCPPPAISSRPAPILCCLANGQVLAVSVQEAINRKGAATPPIEATGDIFASLLGRETKDAYSVTNQDDVSIVIATSQHPKWLPLCGSVYSNRLLLCLLNTATGECVFSVSRQRGSEEVAGCRVPMFPDPLTTQCTISTGWPAPGTSQPDLPTLHYRPCVAAVVCSSHATSIHKDFFLQLFGPEVRLAALPVLLIGSPSGNVFHLCTSQLDYMKTTLKSLCSLGQPVVGLHVTHLPQESAANDIVTMEGDSTVGEGGGGKGKGANALLIVGQRGKVVVCRMSRPGQSIAAFAEFQVPGPILSSVLLDGHCLAYSTLTGCYRICLKSQCMDSQHLPASSSSGNSPVLLSEVAFRCPSKISPHVAFLLPSQTSPTDHNPPSALLTLSPGGKIGWLDVRVKETPSVALGASQAAQDLKQTLVSIEATSRQVDLLKGSILSVNGRLAELNSALSLLCEVPATRGATSSTPQPDSGPFQCRLNPSYKSVGVSGRMPCIGVQLTYQPGRKPIGDGWSLIVQLCPGVYNSLGSGEGGGAEVLSQVVPLGGMQAGRSLQTRVELSHSSLKPLICTVQCSLHYSTVDLESRWRKGCGQAETNHTGVSICICTKSFDVVDFMEASSQTDKVELVCGDDIGQVLGGSGAYGARPSPLLHQPAALIHSLELPVPAGITSRLCAPSAEDSGPPGTTLLASLLPALAHVITSARLSAELTLRAYDGSAVCLRVGQEDLSRPTTLTIMASHRAMLTEVTGSLLRRLQPMSEGVSHDMSHDQLCQQLHALERLSQESSDLLGELAGLGGVWQGGANRSEPLGDSIFQLYCSLRQ